MLLSHMCFCVLYSQGHIHMCTMQLSKLLYNKDKNVGLNICTIKTTEV